MKKEITILFILCMNLQLINGQVGRPDKYYDLDFRGYLRLVSTKNLEYAAEKYNVTISEAAVEIAKIFPDPIWSFNYFQDKEDNSRTGYGYSSELGMTLELGGKRKARIDLARSETGLAKSLLADYFRKLQADAALVFLEALKLNQLYKVSNDSYQTMKQLAEADSIRFRLGSIMEIDALQSKLEAGILFNDLLLSQAQMNNALLQVNLIAGKNISDSLFFPKGKMESEKRDFNPESLIVSAQNNRADLLVALHSMEVSQKSLKLARKERIIDLDMNVGIGNNYLIAAGTPTATTLAAGIAIPLKISNIYKGEIITAQTQIFQTELLFKQAELLIQTEITQAWQLYLAFCRQVDSYNNGLLEDAASVKKGKIYSYQRGETSLLEVLNAQRTYNEIQTTYYEALFNQAAALVELEKSAGIWDINF